MKNSKIKTIITAVTGFGYYGAMGFDKPLFGSVHETGEYELLDGDKVPVMVLKHEFLPRVQLFADGCKNIHSHGFTTNGGRYSLSVAVDENGEILTSERVTKARHGDYVLVELMSSDAKRTLHVAEVIRKGVSIWMDATHENPPALPEQVKMIFGEIK